MNTDTPGTPLTPKSEELRQWLLDRARFVEGGAFDRGVVERLAELDRERRERVGPSIEVWRLGEHAPDDQGTTEAPCLVCGERWPCEPYRFLMELATEAQNARRERVDPDLDVRRLALAIAKVGQSYMDAKVREWEPDWIAGRIADEYAILAATEAPRETWGSVLEEGFLAATPVHPAVVEERDDIDVERLARAMAGIGIIENGTWVSFAREDAEKIAKAYSDA